MAKIMALVLLMLFSGLLPPASGQPAQWRTIRMEFVSYGRSSPEGRELLSKLASGVSGRQSRNLWQDIVDGIAHGKIVREPGCHKFGVTFHDINPNAARSAMYEEGGATKFIDASSGEAVITVNVCDGSGDHHAGGSFSLPLPAPWVSEDSAITISSPLPALRYPASGALRSCGKATAGRCGGAYTPGEHSEFYKLLRQPGSSSAIFVR